MILILMTCLLISLVAYRRKVKANNRARALYRAQVAEANRLRSIGSHREADEIYQLLYGYK